MDVPVAAAGQFAWDRLAAGPHTVHLVRTDTCAAGPPQVTVACTATIVGEPPRFGLGAARLEIDKQVVDGVDSGSGTGPAPADLKILRAEGPDDLPSVLKRYTNQLKCCHHRELVKVPGLEGEVAVGFEIGADGATSKVRVVSSTMKNAAVEACLVGRFDRMVFAPGGGSAVVKMKFTP